jgi:demethylmenaquinone methyltransferase/2-methoxy-6-polyprenyl-1,4-benzoquinol methylase
MKADFRLQVLEYYNRAAEIYDLTEFIRQGTRRKAVRLAGCLPGERVLDVCTGTGEQALAFARLGAHVVGIDISEKMLQVASRKLIKPAPTWLAMDAARLQFPDKSFDISTVSLALHHMPEETQLQVLGEMARVTRRRVVIVEPHAPYRASLWQAWAFVASIVDQSEYMGEWVRQDFNHTCRSAGLEVENTWVEAFSLHRISLCRPA